MAHRDVYYYNHTQLKRRSTEPLKLLTLYHAWIIIKVLITMYKLGFIWWNWNVGLEFHIFFSRHLKCFYPKSLCHGLSIAAIDTVEVLLLVGTYNFKVENFLVNNHLLRLSSKLSLVAEYFFCLIFIAYAFFNTFWLVFFSLKL